MLIKKTRFLHYFVIRENVENVSFQNEPFAVFGTRLPKKSCDIEIRPLPNRVITFVCANITASGSFTVLAGINEEFLITSANIKYFCIITINIKAKTSVVTAITPGNIRAGKFDFLIISLENVKTETYIVTVIAPANIRAGKLYFFTITLENVKSGNLYCYCHHSGKHQRGKIQFLYHHFRKDQSGNLQFHCHHSGKHQSGKID